MPISALEITMPSSAFEQHGQFVGLPGAVQRRAFFDHEADLAPAPEPRLSTGTPLLTDC